MSDVTSKTIHHVATLSNIPVSEAEAASLAAAFEETLEVVANMHELDTSNVEPTHQVTGLENIWREDEVNHDTMFTQKEALANAHKSHQGYFVVDQILSNTD